MTTFPEKIAASLNGSADDHEHLLVLADWYEERGDANHFGLRDVVASGRVPAVVFVASWLDRSWESGKYQVTAELPQTVFRHLVDGNYSDGGRNYSRERVIAAYLDAAQAYAAKREYKRRLRAIHHADDSELFECMNNLTDWLESRGDSEAKGWRWLVDNRNVPECDKCWHWMEGTGLSGLELPSVIYEQLTGEVDEEYHVPSRNYPSRLSALIDAARAAAKIVS